MVTGEAMVETLNELASLAPSFTRIWQLSTGTPPPDPITKLISAEVADNAMAFTLIGADGLIAAVIVGVEVDQAEGPIALATKHAKEVFELRVVGWTCIS